MLRPYAEHVLVAALKNTNDPSTEQERITCDSSSELKSGTFLRSSQPAYLVVKFLVSFGKDSWLNCDQNSTNMRLLQAALREIVPKT